VGTAAERSQRGQKEEQDSVAKRGHVSLLAV